MAIWVSNYYISFGISINMAKKRDKPTEQPAPDPKPHEGSGHSDKGNGSKSS